MEFERDWLESAGPKLEEFWPSVIASTLMDLHYLDAHPTRQFFEDWANACMRGSF